MIRTGARYQLALAGILAVAAQSASAQDAVQVPPVIRQQLLDIQDRFASVLEEECPQSLCSAVGCDVGRFNTLDQTQSSSLPGLEDEPPAGKAQYKLASVNCEFTYEPTLDADALAKLRQRLIQKVKPVGVAVNLRSRQLEQKPEEKSPEPAAPVAPPPKTLEEAVVASLVPVLPWLFAVIIGTLSLLALIWAMRRLGRETDETGDANSPLPASGNGGLDQNAPDATPTLRMLSARTDQLKEELKTDSHLTEIALKKFFDETNLDELSRVVRLFGPETLAPLKEKPEYGPTLAKLSEFYNAQDKTDSAAEAWAFLDRFERSMTAAKIRIDSEPLSDHFAYLASLSVDEFIGILRELDEQEAIAAVAYAPRAVREEFFAHANPAFTAKFVEQLTKVDRMSDSFVRGTAQKMRRVHADKGDTLKQIRVDRIPLLEQALNSLNAEHRRELVNQLGRNDPQFVKQLAPKVFLDDSVPLLPDDVLTEMFLAVSPAEAGDYIGAFSWGTDLLKRLNPRLAESIRRNMAPSRGPEPSPLASLAREKISAFVKKADDAGMINLGKINAELIQ